MSSLEIKDLVVSVEGKTILNGIDLVVESGSVHAIMGPNGSGKSTLSLAIMGHPKYKVERGQVLLDGVNLLKLPVDARARAGVFLAFQYPSAIPGLSVANFLPNALPESQKRCNDADVRPLDGYTCRHQREALTESWQDAQEARLANHSVLELSLRPRARSRRHEADGRLGARRRGRSQGIRVRRR